MTPEAMVEEGRRVLLLEAEAVGAVGGRLGQGFVRACGLLHQARGRVVVSGVGKSGHVARKLASTLTSTGTPAVFLHPVDALHGDLGVVGEHDVALLVSRSGETDEMAGLLDHLILTGVPVVALVGRTDSPLGRHATVALDCSVEAEACPMAMAPTSSTTAAMALGDALAMVVLRLRGFTLQDFAALHPGGALGRRLSVRVRDVMVDRGYPYLGTGARVADCIVPLAEMRGTVPIVDGGGRVVGVVTAGDLTRLMERDRDGFLDRGVEEIMTTEPKVAHPDELGAAAARRMEEHAVMALPVMDDEGGLVGIVHLHDLMRAGAV